MTVWTFQWNISNALAFDPMKYNSQSSLEILDTIIIYPTSIKFSWAIFIHCSFRFLKHVSQELLLQHTVVTSIYTNPVFFKYEPVYPVQSNYYCADMTLYIHFPAFVYACDACFPNLSFLFGTNEEKGYGGNPSQQRVDIFRN